MIVKRVANSTFGATLLEIIAALDDERAAAPPRFYELVDGELVEAVGAGGFVYRFEAIDEVRISEGSRVELEATTELGHARVEAVVEVISDPYIELQLEADLGERVGTARIVIDMDFVLEALRNRLVRLLETPLDDPHAGDNAWEAASPSETAAITSTALGERTVGIPATRRPPSQRMELDGPDSPPPLPALESDLNAKQALAVRRCLAARFHAVWGPPGTGKTRTLAALLEALAMRDERVVLLATAHTAVDQALIAVLARTDMARLVDQGLVFRAGRSRDRSLRDHPQVSLAGRLAAERPDIVDALASARREIRRAWASGDGSAIQAAEGALRAAVVARDEFERLCIDGALVVLSTFAREIVAPSRRPFEAVIVDEASMANIAQVLACTSHGPRRVAYFGDPRQLPPIHHARTPAAHRWLGRDLYAVAEVISRTHERPADSNRMTLLPVQYRMARKLCAIVSELAYAGGLVSGRQAEPQIWLPKGGRVAWLDTAAVGGTAFSADASRVAPLAALAALWVAQVATGRGATVAVVSPYRPQARLLYAGRRLLLRESPLPSTIHGSQGSEADIVIVDLALAPPVHGRFIEADTDIAERLLNVSVSRGRAGLVIVADRVHLSTTSHQPAALRRLAALVDGACDESIDLDGDAGAIAWHGGDEVTGTMATAGVVWEPVGDHELAFIGRESLALRRARSPRCAIVRDEVLTRAILRVFDRTPLEGPGRIGAAAARLGPGA